MATLLQINTSIFSDEGHSTRLASEFVGAWLDQRAGTELVVRDLAREPVPHLTAERFRAFTTPLAERTPEQAAVVAESDRLIDELCGADAVVLGLPMYNYGVPSTLKAYFDHVARAGVTFQYTESGPVGLLADRPVYALAARGGEHLGTPRDAQSTFVREFLALLGITSVEFIYAEGLAMGESMRDAAIERARECIRHLAA